ncbi:MAG: hypothetical protein SWO11_23620 [Thermodesulfobacteriota bacterium]|nr:hypothetical protein [Thermodesulfobacteriota bacterium]
MHEITVHRIKADSIDTISMDIILRIEEILHVRQMIPRVWGGGEYLPLKVKGPDLPFTLMGLDLNRLIYDEKLPWTIESAAF